MLGALINETAVISDSESLTGRAVKNDIRIIRILFRPKDRAVVNLNNT